MERKPDIFIEEYGVTELDTQKVWAIFTEALKANEEGNRHDYWTDGTEILCKNEDSANALADFFEDMGFDIVHTSYYDPEEDQRSGEVDDHTGYWSVYPD